MFSSSLRLRRRGAFLAAALLLCLQAHAADYYVSASGDDAAPGTSPDRPLRTLGKAVALLRDGDSLYLRAGDVFEPAGPLVIERSGTADKPLVIGAYELEGGVVAQRVTDRRPVIDGKTTVPERGSYYGMIHVTGQHVHVRDLEVRRSGGVGVRYEKTQHGLIDNVAVDWSYFAAIQALGASDIAIDNCSATQFGQGGLQYGEPVFPAGISLRNVKKVRVKGCVVYEGWGEGINTFYGSEDVVIENNKVFAARNVGIYVDSTRRAVVRGNMVLGTSSTAYHRYEGWVGQGITLNNEAFQFKDKGGNLDKSAMAADVQIYNNLVAGTAAGIAFWGQMDGTVWKNVSVVHNTFVDNRVQLHIGGAPFAGSLVANNIFLSISPGTRDYNAGFQPAGGLEWGTNYWSQGAPGANVGPVVSDGVALRKMDGWLSLTSHDDVTWKDFEALPTSRTLAAGAALPAALAVSHDFKRARHNDPPDLGAIAFGSGKVPKGPGGLSVQAGER